jgi:hypothetical protein
LADIPSEPDMEPAIWILLPILVAIGSAILSYSVMSSRMEVAVAREKELHAGTQARLRSLEEAIPSKVTAAQEIAKRQAMDQFLTEFRVEERRYLRESKSSVLNRRAIVTQERLYFRNIPLSNWVEQEIPIEDGVSLTMLDHRSVFMARPVGELPALQTASQLN